MNIPIYRARRINSQEDVEGYLIENEQGAFIIKKMTVLPISNKLYTQIDPTTLSIHFPDMLDSQGNKIFASLSEDGKGGDIIHRDGMTFETIYKSVNGRFEAYEINGMHHLLAHKFHQTKVIGIQK